MSSPAADPRLGTFCDLQELAESDHPGSRIHCLTKGQSIGLSLSVESGAISLFSVLFLLGFILSRAIKRGQLHALFRTPMDIYIFSTLCAELLQGSGIVMDALWVSRGKVEVGPYCTIQGSLRQFGESAAAMISIAIAVHTFLMVWLQREISGLNLPLFVIAVVTLFMGLMISVPIALHHGSGGEYMVPTPYWCWIDQKYILQRTVGEYLWLWLAVVVPMALYLVLFLLLLGTISRDKRKPWSVRLRRNHPNKNEAEILEEKRVSRIAYRMMTYPAAYTLTVLPLSIARWVSFANEPVPSYTTFTTKVIFGLSGACNVALLVIVRPGVLLLREPHTTAAAQLRAPSIADSGSRNSQFTMVAHEPSHVV